MAGAEAAANEHIPHSLNSAAEPRPAAAKRSGSEKEGGGGGDGAGAGGEPEAGGGPAASPPPGAASGAREGSGSGGGTPSPPPHPPSYLQVLDMLQRGETPPGIRVRGVGWGGRRGGEGRGALKHHPASMPRPCLPCPAPPAPLLTVCSPLPLLLNSTPKTDIVDTPPDPSAPPPQARLKPRPKPWERHGVAAAAASDSAASDGGLAQEDSGGSAAAAEAWLRQSAQAPVPLPAQPEAAPERAGTTSEQLDGQGRARLVPPSSPAAAFPPRRAASLYEATTPAPDSPGLIAGRLSPGKPPLTVQLPRGQGEVGGEGKAAGGSDGGGGSPGRPGAISPGGGIGRPASTGWRPPPIPAPMFTASREGSVSNKAGISSGGGGGGSGGAVEDGDAAGASGSGGVKTASAASLGTDFAGT